MPAPTTPNLIPLLRLCTETTAYIDRPLPGAKHERPPKQRDAPASTLDCTAPALSSSIISLRSQPSPDLAPDVPVSADVPAAAALQQQSLTINRRLFEVDGHGFC
jgi:hypothetical protein